MRNLEEVIEIWVGCEVQGGKKGRSILWPMCSNCDEKSLGLIQDI